MRALIGTAFLACGLSLGCGAVTDPIDQTGPGQTGGGSGGDASSGGSSGRGGTTGGSAGGGDVGGCSTDPNDDDVDRDGYKKDEDCDDFQNAVNPGAFDVPGNGVDDDCDGGIDNGAGVPCDDASDVIAMDTNDALAMARAMGICGRKRGSVPQEIWGLYDATLWGLRVPWTDTRSDLQHGVHTEFGSTFSPRQGRSMLMLATGIARTGKQPGGTLGSPAFGNPSTGELLPNGFPEDDPICKASYKDTTAWSPIALRVRLRAPTNAVQMRWSARAVMPEVPYHAVCAGQNHLFAAFKEDYRGSSSAVNVARLPDGSLFSVDHLPFVYCMPASFEEGGRPYDFPCPGGYVDAGATPWEGSATDWIDFVVDVVPGNDLTLTMITWAHGDQGSQAFGVFLDNFQWIASPASSPVCGP